MVVVLVALELLEPPEPPEIGVLYRSVAAIKAMTLMALRLTPNAVENEDRDFLSCQTHTVFPQDVRSRTHAAFRRPATTKVPGILAKRKTSLIVYEIPN